jgi:hypothetical protein
MTKAIAKNRASGWKQWTADEGRPRGGAMAGERPVDERLLAQDGRLRTSAQLLEGAVGRVGGGRGPTPEGGELRLVPMLTRLDAVPARSASATMHLPGGDAAALKLSHPPL